MIFNTKSESPLFVDKIPCKMFFFCSTWLINGNYYASHWNGDLFGFLQKMYDQKKFLLCQKLKWMTISLRISIKNIVKFDQTASLIKIKAFWSCTTDDADFLLL